jgi:hypothetical protein
VLLEAPKSGLGASYQSPGKMGPQTQNKEKEKLKPSLELAIAAAMEIMSWVSRCPITNTKVGSIIKIVSRGDSQHTGVVEHPDMCILLSTQS